MKPRRAWLGREMQRSQSSLCNGTVFNVAHLYAASLSLYSRAKRQKVKFTLPVSLKRIVSEPIEFYFIQYGDFNLTAPPDSP